MSLGDHRHQCLPPVPDASCSYEDFFRHVAQPGRPFPADGQGDQACHSTMLYVVCRFAG